MARFYGQVQGKAKTLATRTGYAGIRASAQSFDGSVIVDMRHTGAVSIEIADGSSFYGRTIFTGTIEELETKLCS